MIIKIIIALALLYLCILVAIYFAQTWFIYAPNMPTREIVSTPKDLGLNYETVLLHTKDDQSLTAWFIPAKGATKTVLFMHGNAGNISHRLETIKIYHELGLNFFIFDYRGFGESTGSPSEEGTYIDAEAAWQYLTEQRDIAAEQIIIAGRSLGGGVAAELAKNVTPAMLILESTFLSMPEVSKKHFPFMPTNLIVKHRYETLNKLKKINCPIVVAHSVHDEVIPYSHGEKIFAEAKEPKQFIPLQGGHGNGFLLSKQNYIAGLQQALQSM